MRVGFNADNTESLFQVVGGVVAIKHSDVVHQTHRREFSSSVCAGFAAISCRIYKVTVNSRLREEINCDQCKKKIRNKHCRAGILLRDSLPKK